MENALITSLRMVNFKNFADETLRLGPFTVIVGANASGKSNIRDAFRFLHGIGRGYTLAEIIGGKYGAGGQMEWEGIRGAPNEVARLDPEFSIPGSHFSFQVVLDMGRGTVFYSIQAGFDPFGPDGYRMLGEELKSESDTVYTSKAEPWGHSLEAMLAKTPQWTFNLSRAQPALTQSWLQLMEPPVPLPVEVCEAFASTRFLELDPARMREPSIAGAVVLGDNGQNLPTVLEAIFADPQRKMTLISWLDELSAMDVVDLEFPRDPSGRVHLYIVEHNGRRVSAYSASDGTLRFLGLLAALFSGNRGGLYFFEELDNGIHPNRLWLLLDLIERQTAKGDIQVVTTTHSPALLDWIRDETFENTHMVYRDEYWADSVIRPIAGLSNLRELRKSKGLGRFLTNGWMENTMHFSEGDADTDHLDDDDEEEPAE